MWLQLSVDISKSRLSNHRDQKLASTLLLEGWQHGPRRTPIGRAGACGRLDGPVRAVCRSRGGRGGRGGRADLCRPERVQPGNQKSVSTLLLEGWQHGPRRTPIGRAGACGRLDGPVRAVCRSRGGRGGRGGRADLCRHSGCNQRDQKPTSTLLHVLEGWQHRAGL